MLTDALMDAHPESDMTQKDRGEVEAVRDPPPTRIPVRGAEEHEHLAAGGIRTPPIAISAVVVRKKVCTGTQPDRLVERAGQRERSPAEPPTVLRVGGERVQTAPIPSRACRPPRRETNGRGGGLASG